MVTREARSFRILPLTPRHERAVAGLHRMALPRGFLSELGDSFLSRLYRAIGDAPAAGVWVAERDTGACLGFLSGTANVRACYRSVLRGSGPAILFTMLPSLVRPRVWRRSLETLRYPFQDTKVTEGEAEAREIETPEGSGAELLSVAVAPEARGMGVARALVGAFDEALLRWGHTEEYRVVTDAEDPRSNAFYRGVGFQPVTVFRHHGHPMRMYRRRPRPASHTETSVRVEGEA